MYREFEKDALLLDRAAADFGGLVERLGLRGKKPGLLSRIYSGLKQPGTIGSKLKGVLYNEAKLTKDLAAKEYEKGVKRSIYNRKAAKINDNVKNYIDDEMSHIKKQFDLGNITYSQFRDRSNKILQNSQAMAKKQIGKIKNKNKSKYRKKARRYIKNDMKLKKQILDENRRNAGKIFLDEHGTALGLAGLAGIGGYGIHRLKNKQPKIFQYREPNRLSQNRQQA